jgi:hypothetical protein
MNENDNVDSSGSIIVAVPIVFQCGRCKSIIGDSFSFDRTIQSLNILSLYHTVNTKISNDIHTGTLESEPSEYRTIQCANCSKTLGKKYTRTPQLLTNLIDKFTFSIDEIKSYELGSARKTSSSVDKVNGGNGEKHQLIWSSGNVHTDGDNPAIVNLNSEIDKIQLVLLNIISRLDVIESKMNENEPDTKRAKI